MRLTVMSSLSTERPFRKLVLPEPLFPKRYTALSSFVPSTLVHQSSPESVPRGFSFVAFRLNSVRSLKEKKLVSAIYSIIIILSICFYRERRKNFVSFVLVMTQRPIPFFSCGKTSVMHVVMSMADISKEHAGWECQSPMYSIWPILRWPIIFLMSLRPLVPRRNPDFVPLESRGI